MFSLLAAIVAVSAQLPAVTQPPECCPCDAPISQDCKALAYTCPIGASPASPDICYAPAKSCPDANKEKDWAIKDSETCKCDPETNTTGWQCGLIKPQGCQPPLVWDGSMLNTDPDAPPKRMECTLVYSDIIAGFLPLRDHRIEAYFDMSGEPGQGFGWFKLLTRFVGNTDPKYCSTVQNALSCDTKNCTGETVENPETKKTDIVYTCVEVQCNGCSGNFQPGGENCGNMRMLAERATGNPAQVIFPGGTLDRGQGTAAGVIIVGDGSITVSLDVHCRTGSCVGNIVEPTAPPPESPWTKAMKTCVGVVSALVILALMGWAILLYKQRQITKHIRRDRVAPVPTKNSFKLALSTVSPQTSASPPQGVSQRKFLDEQEKNSAEPTEADFVASGAPLANVHHHNGRAERHISVGYGGTEGGEELAVEVEKERKSPVSNEVAVKADHLKYSIAGRQILKGISLLVRPFELVFIMGPSGAGKTCLLNILSGRTHVLPGEIEGGACVMGSKNSAAHRRAYSSYVPQTETLVTTDTVSEAVFFSAKMRHPHFSDGFLRQQVDRALAALKIQHIADSVIGSPGRGGISGGEKRRVAIAVELVCQPQLLFLDEPTSSLDSTSVRRVLEQMRGLTRPSDGSGCAVVATIHQLPHYFYHKFDKLVLLDCIGRLAFFGTPEDALEMVKRAGITIPAQANAADVLLDICSDTDLSGKMIAAYEASGSLTKLHSALSGPAATPAEPVRQTDHDPIKSRRRLAPFTRFGLLFKRNVKHMAREPSLLLTTIAMTILSTLITGFIFFDLNNRISGTANRGGALFFTCTYFTLTSMSTLGVFLSQQEVFKKEYYDGYYSKFSYFCSLTLSDILFLRLFPPVVFGLITYFMIGFQVLVNKFLIYLGVVILTHLTGTAWCYFMSVVSKTQAQASLITVIFFIYCIMFQGLLVNTNNTDNGFLVIRYASFVMYAFEALMINEFEGLALIFDPIGYPEIAITGETILENYGIDVARLGLDCGILFFFFCIFYLLAMACFFLKHRR